MTTPEYYKILEEGWNNVNKNSLPEISAYNKWKRHLRKQEQKRQLRKETRDGKNKK